MLMKAKNVELALSVIKDIKASKIVPSTSVYNTMLGVLALNGRYAVAKQIWNDMRAHKQPNSVVTYHYLMQSAIRDHKPHEAKQMFHSMQAEGIKPNLRVYLTLLQSVGSAAEADGNKQTT